MHINQISGQDRVAKPGKRHCMIVHSYYPFDETRVQRQAEALADWGFEVDVICLQYSDELNEDHAGGVTIFRLPVRRNKQRGSLAQFFEYLAFLALAFLKLTTLHLRKRYHTVQVHNLPDFLVFAALIPRLSGSRVILDLHDLMPEFYRAKFKRSAQSWPERLLRWQEWLSCHFAHHVITVTESWRQTLIQRGSIHPEKCSVVMNVADPRYFIRSNDGISPEDGVFRLIYHGTFTQRYGVDLILQALDQVRKVISDVRLTLHGRGEYLQEILRLINTLKLQDHVQVSTDFLPAIEMCKLILSNHVGLVPYRRDVFTDGILPTKLMEYVALGLPVVAARTPAINTYFDETMVQFFAPGDGDDLARCILGLYADRAKLAQLAKNAEQFNHRYNWASVATEYIALVEQLAS